MWSCTEFGENRGEEPVESGRVGKYLGDVGPAFDLAVQPFQRVGGPDLRPVGRWEVRECGDVRRGIHQHGLDLEELRRPRRCLGRGRHPPATASFAGLGRGSAALQMYQNVRLAHSGALFQTVTAVGMITTARAAAISERMRSSNEFTSPILWVVSPVRRPVRKAGMDRAR